MKCDHCHHVDYRAAADAGMKFWGVCKLGEPWEFTGRLSECKNGKFKVADEVAIEDRIKKLAGMQIRTTSD